MNIAELLKILACPVCHGELEFLDKGGTGFLCRKCGLVYPIKNDIPVMLVKDAVPLAQWNQSGGEE